MNRVLYLAALPALIGTPPLPGSGPHLQNAGHAWSVRTADGATRFEVRAGDRWAEDGTAPKERSEAYFPTLLREGHAYRIAFSMMIEPGPPNAAKWMVLSQLQSTFRPGDPGHSPPFAVELNGERMRFVTRTADAAVPGQGDARYIGLYTDRNDLERGRWYDLRIEVRLSPADSGAIRVWRDGVQLVDYHGPAGYHEPIGAYFKEGIYRGTSPESFAVRFRGPSIAEIR